MLARVAVVQISSRRGVAVAVAVVVGLTACSQSDTNQDVDLTTFVGQEEEAWPYLNARDITDEECPKLGCEQAIQSDYVSVMKFSSTQAASDFAGGCDCQAADYMVVRFDGLIVTESTRRDIVEAVRNGGQVPEELDG